MGNNIAHWYMRWRLYTNHFAQFKNKIMPIWCVSLKTFVSSSPFNCSLCKRKFLSWHFIYQFLLSQYIRILEDTNTYYRLFLDNFPPTQLNWSCRFLSFLEFWLEFFWYFAWVLSFFHEFLGMFQKSANNLSFVKIFDNKNGVFRGTLRIFPLNWGFHSV